MDPKKIRVAVVFWRLGPYHHARLNAAGQRMQVVGIESCGMENTNAWAKVEGAGSFQKVTLTERHVNSRLWRQELQRRMFQTLDDLKPQVVAIPGWSLVDALIALLWCSLTRTPAIVMSDSTAIDAPRVAWKEWIKGRVVNLCSSALVAGTRHREYVMQLGMPADRIGLGYDVVDNRYFEDKVAEVRGRKSEVSSPSSVIRPPTPAPYFIASARFIEKKNLPRLLEAYARYRHLAEKLEVRSQKSDARSPSSDLWPLVLLGDGPLRPDLCRLISDLGLQHSVFLPGFKQYPELPAYYGLAGAFIHASTTDQWGLVVNEAMASGLPVLVSNRCGCAPDLVHEGVNGFTFDPYDVETIAQAMLRVANMEPGARSKMGDASRAVIANWGPERFVSGLEFAVVKALESGPKASTPLDRLLLRALISGGKSD